MLNLIFDVITSAIMNEMSKMISSNMLPVIVIPSLLAATSLGMTNFQALAQSTSSAANQTAEK